MPDGPPNADKEFLAWLSKTTLSELRAVHSDEPATRAALLRFFQRGFDLGLSLQECMRLLCFDPCQAGSLLRRVGYTDHEYDALVRLVSELPVTALLTASTGAEPSAPPNGSQTSPLSNSAASSGLPSVS